MSGTQQADSHSASGFTLIEILVAFAITAMLLGVLYQVFSTGVRSGAGAENYTKAVLLARSALDASTLTPPAPGESAERIGPFERETSIRLRPDLAPAAVGVVIEPFEIKTRVTWREGVRQRVVSLSTLWLAPTRGVAQ